MDSYRISYGGREAENKRCSAGVHPGARNGHGGNGLQCSRFCRDPNATTAQLGGGGGEEHGRPAFFLLHPLTSCG